MAISAEIDEMLQHEENEMNTKPGEQCDHGQLKRQCPLCEKDEEIAELKDRFKNLFQYADEVKDKFKLAESKDHYVYTGSMNAVEDLQEACHEAFEFLCFGLNSRRGKRRE